MKIFHKILYLPLLVLAMLSIGGCDKLDDNGPFEGYWLLLDTEGYDGNRVTDHTGQTLVTEGGHLSTDIDTQLQQTIVWCVRNELIEIHNLNQSTTSFYFCHFLRTTTNLTLTEVFHNDGSNDTKVDFTDMPENLCIPADGKFEVLSLTNKEMSLKANGVTLKFKKN